MLGGVPGWAPAAYAVITGPVALTAMAETCVAALSADPSIVAGVGLGLALSSTMIGVFIGADTNKRLRSAATSISADRAVSRGNMLYSRVRSPLWLMLTVYLLDMFEPSSVVTFSPQPPPPLYQSTGWTKLGVMRTPALLSVAFASHACSTCSSPVPGLASMSAMRPAVPATS